MQKLAVAVSWGDTWMDAVTTIDRPIALGTDLRGAADRMLATPRGDHAILHVPQGARATCSDGSILDPGDHRLAPGDRARVEWGGLVFAIGWSDDVAALERVGRDDAAFVRVFGMTAVVHGVLVLAALGTPKSQMLTGDLLRARGHIRAEVFVPAPKPKAIEKTALNSTGPARPSGLAPKRTRPAKAKDAGLLAFLGGGSLSTSSVFSQGGLSGLNDAMAGLSGPGRAGGGDGLDGLRGRGPGGPGGVVGIGDLIDASCHGTRASPPTGLSRRGPTVLAGPRIHVENISKEEIGRVIRNHLPRFKHCYERSLTANPNSSGKVSVGFTIAPNGAVAMAEIRESSLDSPGVEECVVSVMKSLKFPQPKGGGVAVVTYPFVFASAGD